MCQSLNLVDMGLLLQVLFILLIFRCPFLRSDFRFLRPSRTQNYLAVLLILRVGTFTGSLQTIEISRIFVLLFRKQIPVFRHIVEIQPAPHIELPLSGVCHIRLGKVKL